MVNIFLGNKVYVDANVLIYAMEVPADFPKLRPQQFEPFIRGELTIVTSWITLAEVLVKPLSVGDGVLENAYRQFLRPSGYLEILSVDQAISDQAAILRSQHGLRLPDAIHVATGMAANCTLYVSGDAKWGKIGIPVVAPT